MESTWEVLAHEASSESPAPKEEEKEETEEQVHAPPPSPPLLSLETPLPTVRGLLSPFVPREQLNEAVRVLELWERQCNYGYRYENTHELLMALRFVIIPERTRGDVALFMMQRAGPHDEDWQSWVAREGSVLVRFLLLHHHTTYEPSRWIQLIHQIRCL